MSIVVISHTVGAFSNINATEVAGKILRSGLKSKRTLENEGVLLKDTSIKGIFSDEDTNIYFWADPDSYGEFKVEIKLDADASYTYSSWFRGGVDYFLYAASRLRLTEYHKERINYEAMQEQFPDKDIIQHPILATPIILTSSQQKFKLDILEYSAEVPVNTPIIDPSFFVRYSLRGNYTELNSNKLIEQNDVFLTRGIFIDEDRRYITPNAIKLPDDYGHVSLLQCQYGPCCRSAYIHDAQIDSSKPYIMNASYTKDLRKNEHYPVLTDEMFVVKGNEQDNRFIVLNNVETTLWGKEGADLFCFGPESHSNHVIIDFSPQEGDRIVLKQNEFYSSAEEAAEGQISKEGDFIIVRLNNLASVVLCGQEGPLNTDAFLMINNVYDFCAL
jgi:hypothetical protein